MSEPVLDDLRLRRLIDAGRGLISNLDVDAVLQQLLDVAREVTGARYAAVGVLDDRRRELERFIPAGVDAETHRAIGDLPRGRGDHLERAVRGLDTSVAIAQALGGETDLSR